MNNLQYSNDKYEIRNTGTLQDLEKEVEKWVDIHLGREIVIPNGYITME
jgi:hypothetical protein